jgi:hypothetical protein
MASNLPQSIPDWLLERWHAVGQTPPRYEASLYGPFNGILAMYFLPQQRFLVKPQAKVRPDYEYYVGEVERRSFDSYNQPVQPRGQGDESDLEIPDFIVVKGSATLTNDIPLLIVELKREDSDEAIAKVQIASYMEALFIKFEKEGMERVWFKAALVRGTKVSVYSDL